MTSRRRFLEAAALASTLGTPDHSEDVDVRENPDLPDFSHGDLPRVTVEVEVDLPPSVERIARQRYELGRAQPEVSDPVLEEYLLDHVELEFFFATSAKIPDDLAGQEEITR